MLSVYICKQLIRILSATARSSYDTLFSIRDVKGEALQKPGPVLRAKEDYSAVVHNFFIKNKINVLLVVVIGKSIYDAGALSRSIGVSAGYKTELGYEIPDFPQYERTIQYADTILWGKRRCVYNIE